MFFSNTYPVSISDISQPIKSVPDKVFGGTQNFNSSRNIYVLNEACLYKNQIISVSKDGVFLNIIGAKAEKRNYQNRFSIFSKFKILNAQLIQNEKNNFFFIPHNKHKSNYWHCLFDNISQLAFISQNVEDLNVIMPNTVGDFIKKYVLFLKRFYKFRLQFVDENTPLKIKSRIVFTEPSLFGEFEHNHAIGLELINIAKEIFKKKKLKIERVEYKHGSIPHRFKINKNNKTEFYKCYSMPWSTPVRRSSLEALRNFSNFFSKKNLLKKKIIYSQRVGENPKDLIQRNPLNENLILKEIKKKFKVEIIDFSKINFDQQVKIMTQTKLFICVHGSGPANIAYMSKNTGLVEIMPYDYSVPITQMSRACADGLGIYYKRVDGIPSQYKDKYNVEISKVLKAINEMNKLI